MSRTTIYSFYKSVPNPEPYTNDKDKIHTNVLLSGVMRLLVLKDQLIQLKVRILIVINIIKKKKNIKKNLML
jgi:hypothetical protein